MYRFGWSGNLKSEWISWQKTVGMNLKIIVPDRHYKVWLKDWKGMKELVEKVESTSIEVRRSARIGITVGHNETENSLLFGV